MTNQHHVIFTCLSILLNDPLFIFVLSLRGAADILRLNHIQQNFSKKAALKC